VAVVEAAVVTVLVVVLEVSAQTFQELLLVVELQLRLLFRLQLALTIQSLLALVVQVGLALLAHKVQTQSLAQ
jgi:hypothetical protein